MVVTQVGLDVRLVCAGCGGRVVLSRERLRSGQVVDFFGQPQDLATRVVAALPQAAAALRA